MVAISAVMTDKPHYAEGERAINALAREVEALRAEIERLRAALQVYADEYEGNELARETLGLPPNT